MKNVISKLRASTLLRQLLFVAILVLFGLYCFSIPSFSGRSGLNYLLYGILGLLTVCVVGYCYLYNKRPKTKVIYFIPAFALYGLLGTAIFSHDFRGWITTVLLAVSFLVMYLSFLIIEDNKIIFNIFIFAFFIFTLYYIVHYRSEILHFSSYGTEAFRLGTDFTNENDVALFAIVALAFTFHELCFAKSYLKVIYVVPTLTTLLVGLTTGSRTFIILAGVIILLLLYFRFIDHKIVYFVVLVAFILVFLILLSLPFMETLRTRLTKMFETFFGKTSNQIDYSSVSRSIWFNYGFTLGSKNILIGYGYAGFSIYSGVGTFTHSNITEVFCDFGIIGLFLFYAPYPVLAVRCIKTKNKLTAFVIMVVASLLFLSFSMVYFYNKFYYIALAICFYIAYNQQFETQENLDFSTCRTILLIGNSGLKSNDKGGQTTKLRLYQKKMIDEGFVVNLVDLENFHKHPFKVLTAINDGLKTCRRVVLISGERACRLLIPFIISRNRRKAPFILPVVGSGVLHFSIDKLSDEDKLKFFNNHEYSLGKRIKSIEENLQQISKILVETELLKDVYSNFYHLENCEVLENFRDTTITPKEEKTNEPLKLVYLSRVMRLKGVFDLMDVVKRIEEDYPNRFTVDVYGSKSFNKDDEALFNNYQSLTLKYCGELDNSQVIDTLKGYDMLIFPTNATFEGTPGVIAESLIAGTPVLTSSFPQVSLLLEDKVNSIWFKMFDNDNFEEKLRYVLEHPEIIAGMIKKCQICGQKFTYSYHRDRFLRYVCGVK